MIAAVLVGVVLHVRNVHDVFGTFDHVMKKLISNASAVMIIDFGRNLVLPMGPTVGIVLRSIIGIAVFRWSAIRSEVCRQVI